MGFIKQSSNNLLKFQLPLQFVFIVPFLLEIVLTVGIVGYISLKNGQKAVDNLVQELIEETGNRIESEVNHFLEILPKIAFNHQNFINAKRFDLIE